eukprot:707874-Prymnesium_polylepis.1
MEGRAEAMRETTRDALSLNKPAKELARTRNALCHHSDEAHSQDRQAITKHSRIRYVTQSVPKYGHAQ